MLPSPVFCRQPASAAPRLSAVMALADSAPKLIPEMLTTESGRNACRRPRGAPSTFAHGIQACSPVWLGVRGAGAPDGRGLVGASAGVGAGAVSAPDPQPVVASLGAGEGQRREPQEDRRAASWPA